MEFYNEENNAIQEKNTDMVKTFNRMFLGLIVTAIVAYFTFTSGLILTIPYMLIAIVEIVVVLIFSFAFKKLSSTAVTILYFVYAVLNGLTMSTIFAVFDMADISTAFLISAFLFGALAIYGHTTDRDITKLGNIFMVGLIIGIIMSLINLFIGNSMINIILDWVMLLLFCGITAYDIQKMKILAVDIPDKEKLYVYFAMQLYLDFINIFIRILSIMARRSRR